MKPGAMLKKWGRRARASAQPSVLAREWGRRAVACLRCGDDGTGRWRLGASELRATGRCSGVEYRGVQCTRARGRVTARAATVGNRRCKREGTLLPARFGQVSLKH